MSEDELTLALIGLWGAFVICVVAYIIYRLCRDPTPTDLSESSKSMARMMGFPKLFDALVARPMTVREKFGWLLIIALMAIVAFLAR